MQRRWDCARVWLCALLLITAGFAAYSNSFGGAFLFDDAPQVVKNRHIRSLALTRQGRLEVAEAQLNEALRLQPDYATARRNLDDTLKESR